MMCIRQLYFGSGGHRRCVVYYRENLAVNGLRLTLKRRLLVCLRGLAVFRVISRRRHVFGVCRGVLGAFSVRFR